MDALLPSFMEITNKMVQNVTRTNLPNIFSLLETENIKSMSPCEPSNLNIINFSGKKVRFTWIDYEGNDSNNSGIINHQSGSKVNFGTYTNHVYRINFDADDSNSESIYIRIPEDKNIVYIGNEDLNANYIEMFNESSWVNNPCLNSSHLEQIKNKIKYKADFLNKFETYLTRSTYYDDSSETQMLIKSFFESFNPNNKFIDAFFNPLNLLDKTVQIKRVSDHDVDVEKKVIPSVYLGQEFRFDIHNDTENDFNIFWINYQGKATHWSVFASKSSHHINTHLGNVWAVSNTSLTYIFQTGQAPLLKKSGCTINVSQLPAPYQFDIQSYEAKKSDSIIIDANDLEKYNARQGCIGNCWFLQSLISIYAMYPQSIISAYLMPEFIETTGVVAMRLWSSENKCWRLVIMDDYLPCMSDEAWFCSSPSGILKNRFWVSFIEKAIAKQIGSFKKLEANQSCFSVQHLHEVILGPKMTGFKTISIPEKDHNYEVFNQLVENFNSGNVCSFSSRHSKNNQLIDSVTKMVSYHGYGLLEIKENVLNSGLTFVKCQNPWSQGGEWGGDWGDSSSLWNTHPDIKNELGFEKKDDGTFWIEKKDLSKAFSLIWIAICSND